jgi:hypothetical protein
MEICSFFTRSHPIEADFSAHRTPSEESQRADKDIPEHDELH